MTSRVLEGMVLFTKKGNTVGRTDFGKTHST
jgi:hypothetical protein